MKNTFQQLGLPTNPVFLAPLAGVSDAPFRMMCTRHGGADLAYVEMLSATALVHGNQRTSDMMFRHPDEALLGAQVTGRNPEELGQAVAILSESGFDTIDINMGCPVRKVVQTGCGSALIRDPELVFQMTQAAVKASSCPLSVKIRLGWDRSTLNYLEVAQAVEAGGGAWLTVHGRTRADDYSVAVDLEKIGEIKSSVRIPVIGNGNIFSAADAALMRKVARVDGIMVSRGALGNPWIFHELKTGTDSSLARETWYQGLLDHLKWQIAVNGEAGRSLFPMRKHLLWYLKGWPGAKNIKEQIMDLQNFEDVAKLLAEFNMQLKSNRIEQRDSLATRDSENLFTWNPSPEIRELGAE